METKRDRVLSIFFSVLLHLIILACLLYPYFLDKSDKQDPPKSEQNGSSERLSDDGNSPKNEAQFIEVDIVESSSESGDKPCTLESSNYIGIGIVHSLISQEILQAPAEYPAARAGIRAGDIYLNSSDSNGYKTVEILRDGITLKFRIKMQPICYEQ